VDHSLSKTEVRMLSLARNPGRKRNRTVQALLAAVLLTLALLGCGKAASSSAEGAANNKDATATSVPTEATPSPDNELNRQTLDERVTQDQLAKEKGESYVKDTYRLRWDEDRDDPLALYLYLRYANPEPSPQANA
jgi:hypothetical protein